MASERIDDLISEKAFKQVDDLTAKLNALQAEFIDNIDASIKLNNAISGSKSFKDLEANTQKATLQLEKLRSQQLKNEEVELRIQAKKDQIAAREEARLKKQIALDEKRRLAEEKKNRTILSNSAAEVEAAKQNAAGNSEITSTLNDYNKAQTDAANSATALTSSINQNTESVKRSNLTKKQTARLIAEEKYIQQQNNKELKNTARENLNAKGSLEQRRAALIRLNMVYDNQSPAERASAAGQRLQRIIQGLNVQVLSLEKNTGRSQRNVGNYTSALGGLTRAYGFLRTAANILPGLGISGIILLAFEGLKKLYDLMKSSGSVLKTTNELNNKANENYAEQITKVNILSREISRGNLSQERSKEIIDELNEVSPVYFNGLKTQSDLITKFPDMYDKYNAALILNSKIEAAKSLITEKYRKQLELQQKVINQVDGGGDWIDKIADAAQGASGGVLLSFFGKGLTGVIAEAGKEAEGLDKELKFLFDDLAKNQEALNNMGGDPSGKGFLKRKAEMERLSKLAIELAKKQDEALFALNASRLKRTAELDKKAMDDEKNTLDQRLDALDKFIKTQTELIQLEEKQALKNTEITENDRIRIKEEASAKIIELTREQYITTQKLLQDNLAKEDEIRLKANQKALSLIEIQRDEELLALSNRFSAGKINQEEYEKERLEILFRSGQALISEEIRQTQAFIEIQKKRGVDTADAEAKLAALRIKYSDDVTAKEIKNLEKIAEQEKLITEKRKELGKELFNLGQSLVEGGFQREQERLIKESEAIDIKKAKEIEEIDRSIASEQEKADKIAIINAKAQSQKEALERKQRQLDISRARFERMANIAQIIGSTAAAVAKALPNIPLSILIGAIGAAQLATVLAVPLPKFEKGGKKHGSGLAEFGHGTELRIDPDGRVSLTPSTPTVGYVQHGTEFVSNKDLMRMIAKPDPLTSVGGRAINMDKVIDAQERSRKEIVGAINANNRRGAGVGYYSTAKGRNYINRNI